MKIVLRLIGALIVIGVVAAAMAIAPSIPSAEKEYEIADPDVTIRLQEDGSLIVRESLPFDFTGNFSGAYRDIPLLDGVRITDAQVRDAVEGAYRPGGNTALGSFDDPGTFGTKVDPDGVRVVWHYSAADETRIFDLVYRVVGATRVYELKSVALAHLTSLIVNAPGYHLYTISMAQVPGESRELARDVELMSKADKKPGDAMIQ